MHTRTDEDIHTAVKEWLAAPGAAVERYGRISDWDVSRVTNIRNLFMKAEGFNDDQSQTQLRKRFFMNLYSYLNNFALQTFIPLVTWPVGHLLRSASGAGSPHVHASIDAEKTGRRRAASIFSRHGRPSPAKKKCIVILACGDYR